MFIAAALCVGRVQLERDRQDLRSQVRLLKECRDAAEDELNARVQSAEEVARQRAESSALRFVRLCVVLPEASRADPGPAGA